MKTYHASCHCQKIKFDISWDNGRFFAVNLATVNNITPEEIISAPVVYENGLENDQMNPLKETRHL